MFAKLHVSESSPLMMQRYLSKVSYPAEKEEIVRSVSTQYVPGSLLDSIREIPQGTYLCTMDVLQEIEECERASEEDTRTMFV